MPVTNISITAIRLNPYQPASRLEAPIEMVRRIAESIKQHGLLQTPVVREIGGGGTVYQMADGWLRLQAYFLLDKYAEDETWAYIPCDVRELTDRQMADMVMEANTVRQDLTAIDKAHFYRKYLADFGLTQAEFALQQKCSQGEISNTLRLLELPDNIQSRIISRDISETHARYLVQLHDPLYITLLADEIVREGLSVAKLDLRIKELLGKEKKPAPAVAVVPPVNETANRTVNEVVEPDAAPVLIQKLENEAGEEEDAAEQKCRICGCTDLAGCIEGCHWVEADLCSVCAEEQGITSSCSEPPVLEGEAVEITGPASQPASHGSRAGLKALASKVLSPTKPVTKHMPPTPTPTPAPASAPKPTWQRKLVLEERGGFVMASVMREGAFPVMHRLEGSLELVLSSVPALLSTATEQWMKEAK